MFGDGNCFTDVMTSRVDVKQSAMLQASSAPAILFLGDVALGLIEKLESLMKASAPRHVRIDGDMFIGIFVIVDGRFLDYVDGVIDFVHGVPFLGVKSAAIGTLEVSAGVAEVGKRVQVGGMILS